MKPVTVVGAVVALGLFGMWGTAAQRHNAEHDAAQVYHLKSLVVPVETLKVKFEGTRASVIVQETPGRSPHAEYQWFQLETTEWLLTSKRALKQTCPVLVDFVLANGSFTEVSPEKLDVLSLALKGKTATVRAYVPRFTDKPRGLEACAGYTYDSAAGLLRIGGKAVALMTDLPTESI